MNNFETLIFIFLSRTNKYTFIVTLVKIRKGGSGRALFASLWQLLLHAFNNNIINLHAVMKTCKLTRLYVLNTSDQHYLLDFRLPPLR